mmetsp:Transcript_17773/g.31398  ORF Transcript_17773/g.31398 Transcript_17773/m.31398 type:complete len:234 (+) Transcript_17773:140-841(+)
MDTNDEKRGFARGVQAMLRRMTPAQRILFVVAALVLWVGVMSRLPRAPATITAEDVKDNDLGPGHTGTRTDGPIPQDQGRVLLTPSMWATPCQFSTLWWYLPFCSSELISRNPFYLSSLEDKSLLLPNGRPGFQVDLITALELNACENLSEAQAKLFLCERGIGSNADFYEAISPMSIVHLDEGKEQSKEFFRGCLLNIAKTHFSRFSWFRFLFGSPIGEGLVPDIPRALCKT